MSKSDKKLKAPQALQAPQAYSDVPRQVVASDAYPAVPDLTFYGSPVKNGVTKEQYDQYANDLYEPANRSLTDTYNTQLGNEANAAATNGTINSIGFQDYKQNSLDKGLATGRAHLQSQANLDAIATVNNLVNQDYTNKLSRADLIQSENQVRNNYAMQGYNSYETARANRVNESQQKYRDRGWLKKICSF